MVKVYDMGLAAYMKLKGVMVKGIEGKSFLFDTGDVPLSQWKIDYANSCCSRHDKEILGLKQMMQEG